MQFQRKRKVLPAIKAGSVEMVPVVDSIRFQPPGYRGIMVWNRPVSIDVRWANGVQRSIPISDPTRKWQGLILLAGLLISVLIWLNRRG